MKPAEPPPHGLAEPLVDLEPATLVGRVPDLPPPARISRRRGFRIGASIVLAFVGAFAASYWPMLRDQRALAVATQNRRTKRVRVDVATPVEVPRDQTLTLPGSVHALEEIIIYPRAGGYVAKWYVDMGDSVKQGDLLAEIDTPEIDDQMVQARAQLAQAEASLVLAKANAEFSKKSVRRYEELTPSGLASQEELEKRRVQTEVDDANVGVASANVRAQSANLQRMGRLKSFGRVLAPFAGVITERQVDRGMLVTAGTASPLFRIASVDPARVVVQVPQEAAHGMKVGGVAQVKARELSGRVFEGQVAHVAGALDASTRTMAVEVRVPNLDGDLMPGMYTDVTLARPSGGHALAVPVTAVMSDAKGLRVAVVSADERVHWVPITVARDTGSTIEVASGLDGSERVVKRGNSDLVEGQVVELAR